MKDDSHVLVATYIELDKDKIEREGVYDYEALLRRLDDIFNAFNLMALEGGYLYGNLPGADYKEADENQTGAMYYLTKCKWFVSNVKTWVMSFSYANGKDRVWHSVIKSVKEYGLDKVVRYVE